MVKGDTQKSEQEEGVNAEKLKSRQNESFLRV